MAEYIEKVKNKLIELQPLFARMDEDRDLVNNVKYILTDVNNNPVPDTVSVTINDPVVFAANVEAALQNASEQVVVETDDKKIDTAYIEDMIKASFASADALLRNRGIFPLGDNLVQQVCRRGRAAARCLFRFEQDELITDIVRWDTRFMAYAMDYKGMSWASYSTNRQADAIGAEWPREEFPGIPDSLSGFTEVVDIWARDHNEVWIGGKQVIEQPNPWGIVPVVLQIVPLGSMQEDEASIVNQGESIFFLIRNIVPEFNRLVSILQTINLQTILGGKEFASALGDKLPEEDGMGTRTAVEIGGGWSQERVNDVRNAAMMLLNQMDKMMQRGGANNFDLGTFNQAMSAIALIEIGEGRDQVYKPRLGSKGLIKQGLAEMFIDQIIKTGQRSVEIGASGHKRTFDVSKLEGEYSITYKYFGKSPGVDMARHTVAAHAKATGLIPDSKIRRDILQSEDPDEDERLLRIQMAEELSPMIKLERSIRALAEEGSRGDDIAGYEAELMALEAEVDLDSMLAGNLPEAQQKPVKQGVKQGATPMLPLFDKGGGRQPLKSGVVPQEANNV